MNKTIMALFFNKAKEPLIETGSVVSGSRLMGVAASHSPRSNVIVPKTGKQ